MILAIFPWFGFPGTSAWGFGIGLVSTGISMVAIGRGAQRRVESGGFGSETTGT